MSEVAKLNIYQKLAKVRKDISKANLTKTGNNKYSNFTYFELSDFLPTAIDLFEKYGLLSVFNIKDDLAVLDIYDSDTDKVIQFSSPLGEVEVKGMQGIQKLGSQITYLKRYNYMNALEITEHDIVDAAERVETKTEVTLATYNQITDLQLLYGDRIAGMLEHNKIKDLGELSSMQAQQYINIEKKKQDELSKEKNNNTVPNIKDIV